MPSKRASTVGVEYVTVFCTHRPSLFPILTFDIMLTNIIYIIFTDKVSLKIHIQPLKIAQNFAFANAQIGS